MARKINETEYIQKRGEILAVAQALVFSKGYELMSIQDVLNAMNISKGAFYHYFNSKQDLLEALIDRMQQEGRAAIGPVLCDPTLSALEKLEGYFTTGAAWKSQYKPAMLAILRIWYADENALVREKIFTRSVKDFAPELAGVVRQGIREGVFHTGFPDQVAEFILLLLQTIGYTFATVLLGREGQRSEQQRDEDWLRMKTGFDAYTEVLERVLGAPQGAVRLIDAEILKGWLV